MTNSNINRVHVFVGRFPSRDEACLYSEAQWEPPLEESATEDEYAAWEERNPRWLLRDDLGVNLDPDFIETIDGNERYDYLRSYFDRPEEIELIRNADSNANILVLLFPESLPSEVTELKSTTRLTYCGGFDFHWP